MKGCEIFAVTCLFPSSELKPGKAKMRLVRILIHAVAAGFCIQGSKIQFFLSEDTQCKTVFILFTYSFDSRYCCKNVFV